MRTTDKKARIANIQRFCMHDGPGVRTTVFFKGCPLRCAWCHNPETQLTTSEILFCRERCIGCGACVAVCPAQAHQIGEEHRFLRENCAACGACAKACPTGALELSGREMSVDEILEIVKKDSAFYGERGGVTLSGGEPMAQPEAALCLLEAAKTAGMTTALETCGVFPRRYLPELVPLVDTFLWDYKDSDAERLRKNTGASLSQITENMLAADALGASIRLRCILIRDVNNTEEHARNVRRLSERLSHYAGYDVIRYHPMGQSKYAQLGREDRFDTKERIPTEEDVRRFTEIMDQQ